MKVSLVNEAIRDSVFRVSKNEELILNIVALKEFPDVKIEVHVEEGASFVGALADFSNGDGTFDLKVILEGERSSCYWHSSCLSSSASKKIIDTSLSHQFGKTKGEMINYGIVKDEGQLTLTGVSEIAKGSKKSDTKQSAKIIVFDENCLGKASPVLKIDENDVKASHAAIAGKLNEDHIFYLLSRGLNEQEAKRLITLGYLKPITNYIFDDQLKVQIEEAIERGI